MRQERYAIELKRLYGEGETMFRYELEEEPTSRERTEIIQSITDAIRVAEAMREGRERGKGEE